MLTFLHGIRLIQLQSVKIKYKPTHEIVKCILWSHCSLKIWDYWCNLARSQPENSQWHGCLSKFQYSTYTSIIWNMMVLCRLLFQNILANSLKHLQLPTIIFNWNQHVWVGCYIHRTSIIFLNLIIQLILRYCCWSHLYGHVEYVSFYDDVMAWNPSRITGSFERAHRSEMGSHHKGQAIRSFDVSFFVGLNMLFKKWLSWWWFETHNTYVTAL